MIEYNYKEGSEKNSGLSEFFFTAADCHIRQL